jgi:SAM-dependent methyltransferase
VSFNVPAEAYDSFMGRYSAQLAAQMADLAGVESGQRVVDVGCGPGALTTELVARVAADNVAAIDPSESFVDAVALRLPGVDVRRAAAEELPFDADTFDAALAQLVVHFMAEPVRGLDEMARVTRTGGVVAACVWDHAGGRTPLAPFWRAVRELDPGAADESGYAGGREGHLRELFGEAGLRDIEDTALPVHVNHESFDEWWEPFTLGVGPAGVYLTGLEPERQEQLRELARDQLRAPFTLETRAWAARGIV